MAQILIVDDEVGIRELLSEILADEGHRVELADSAGAARRARERQRPDLVLLDIWMPDTDGITLLKEWAASGQLTMPVVVMSGHGTIETAVEATRIGALDYLEKPIALQRLLDTVKRALRISGSDGQAALSIASVGKSPVLVEARKRLGQLAQSSAPLLLRGEAGVRGEPFARLLVVPGTPFVPAEDVLASPSSELLAKAAGGVLFVADLASLTRPERKNLEFILARAERYRLRLVSCCQVDPRALVTRMEFERELIDRLAEVTFRLPALHQYADDVPELAAALLVRMAQSGACASRRLSEEAKQALARHSWPGDLGELEAVMKDLALSALEEEIRTEDVARVLAGRETAQPAPDLGFDRPFREARESFERLYFAHLLERENGSMSRVAERAGLERTHLYRKLKALGLQIGRREEE